MNRVHWIALVKDVHNDRCLVYDSFGRTHTKIIPNLRFSGNGRVVDTDRDPEQHPKETNCGQRCLEFYSYL
jgi:Ulp1 family protease